MFPTLDASNRIVVTKTTALERFDLVVLQAPNNKSKYVKRIIGIPGDRVEMKNDMLYVNRKTFDETYVHKEIEGSSLSQHTNNLTLQEITGNSVVPEGSLLCIS